MSSLSLMHIVSTFLRSLVQQVLATAVAVAQQSSCRKTYAQTIDRFDRQPNNS